jgi:hydrogenase maturation protease
MNVTVFGVGQSLRGDDGIGPEAVCRWSLMYPSTAADPRVQILLLETPGLNLLDFLEKADSAVLVDAVSTGQPAGRVQVITQIPDSGLSAAEKTAHGFGIAETLSVARKTRTRLPEHLILIGIEGKNYELGSGLSDPVRAALTAAVEKIQEIVINFLSTKSTKDTRN